MEIKKGNRKQDDRWRGKENEVNEVNKTDKKESILIVDDDQSTSKTLTLIFRKKGYETETAGTGKEAMEKTRGRFFNLALLDIKLPDMDGVELVTRLKEIHPDMVVMMITAYASVDTAVHTLIQGASAYITKPVNMDELLATTESVLEKQRLIEEKRRAEEALKESKEFSNSLITSMQDGFSVLNHNGVHIDANPALCQSCSL